MAAQNTFVTPNMHGQFWIGDVMTEAPTDISEFLHNLTDQKNASKSVAGSNAINSTDEDIYGTNNSITIILSNKRSYDVTLLVKIDDAPDSLYTRIREAFYDVTGPMSKCSFLARTIDPNTGLPLAKDYFCAEANMTVSEDPGFGDAGALMEVSLSFSELVGGELIPAILGGGITTLEDAPTLTTIEDGMTYDVTNTKTFADFMTDLGATAISGDGSTIITPTIELLDKDGAPLLPTGTVPVVPGVYSYVLQVEEGFGAGIKADRKAVSILINTGAVEPAATAKKVIK